MRRCNLVMCGVVMSVSVECEGADWSDITTPTKV